MTRKKSISEDKELSQAGMVRINLSFYTLSSIKKVLETLGEGIHEALFVCEVLGQSLLLQMGLSDKDVTKYHKEHLVELKKTIDGKDMSDTVKKISKDALASLPFHYDKEKDEFVLSEKIDGEVERLKKKFIEGFT